MKLKFHVVFYVFESLTWVWFACFLSILHFLDDIKLCMLLITLWIHLWISHVNVHLEKNCLLPYELLCLLCLRVIWKYLILGFIMKQWAWWMLDKVISSCSNENDEESVHYEFLEIILSSLYFFDCIWCKIVAPCSWCITCEVALTMLCVLSCYLNH